MPTAAEVSALVVGVLVSVLLIGVAFYFLRWMRRRQAQGRHGTPPTPEVASDRAYNRLALARREADVLASQGTDVDRARSLIALSEASLRQREFDRAYELAQSAHETLVTLRRRTGRPPSTGAAPLPSTAALTAVPVSRTGETPTAGPATLPSPSGEGGAAADVAGKLPKNRLESQFQLRLLAKELGPTNGKGDGAPPGSAARDLYTQAQAAFDRGDYTESLRLALKGRRQLGGTIETLGPPLPAGDGHAPGPVAPVGSVESVERAATGARCANCGNPIVEGDTFCRSCGASRAPLTCPTCGAERRPADQFCGRCGKRYA